MLPGKVKDQDPKDVTEWIYDDGIADYHSFTVPYGPKYHAKRIERLLYTKGFLHNSEGNVKNDSKVNLCRHPYFIGDAGSVIHKYCGFAPIQRPKRSTTPLLKSAIFISSVTSSSRRMVQGAK